MIFSQYLWNAIVRRFILSLANEFIGLNVCFSRVFEIKILLEKTLGLLKAQKAKYYNTYTPWFTAQGVKAIEKRYCCQLLNTVADSLQYRG